MVLPLGQSHAYEPRAAMPDKTGRGRLDGDPEPPRCWCALNDSPYERYVKPFRLQASHRYPDEGSDTAKACP